MEHERLQTIRFSLWAVLSALKVECLDRKKRALCVHCLLFGPEFSSGGGMLNIMRNEFNFFVEPFLWGENSRMVPTT